MPDLTSKLPPYLPLILLTLAIIVGVIWTLRVWRETHGQGDDDAVTPEELIQEFREAHAAGELSDAEFQRVRELLKSATSRGGKGRGLWDDALDFPRPAKKPSPPLSDAPMPGSNEAPADLPRQTDEKA